MTAFDRVDFSADNLFDALCAPKQTRRQVASLGQAQYLARYLAAIGATTIIVEHDYIDGDYLDDYAAFYVKSFAQYPRWCKRLHFFRDSLSADAFRDAVVNGGAAEALQAAYLGFVVARPVPYAPVGRTLVATYPSDNGRRHYSVARPYEANLFGLPLTVSSLAFQQQDRVLAACATVALWSSFHGTSRLFNTRLPTPAQITQAATGGELESRPLPSKGLRLHQMVRAVRELGLEPDVYRYTQETPLLSLLAAYADFGIPPILGVFIEGYGDHAVTVVGYSVLDAAVRTHEDVSTPTLTFPMRRVGRRIDELYVHDDGDGPFARLRVHTAETPSSTEPMLTFAGGRLKKVGEGAAPITPRFVLVPVHPKLRLSFTDANTWVTRFAYLMAESVEAPHELEWSLTLATTNQTKSRLRASALDPADVGRVLFKPLPRFLWVARVVENGRVLAEVLIDGTAVSKAFPVVEVLFRDGGLRDTVRQILGITGIEDVASAELVDFLCKQVALGR